MRVRVLISTKSPLMSFSINFESTQSCWDSLICIENLFIPSRVLKKLAVVSYVCKSSYFWQLGS